MTKIYPESQLQIMFYDMDEMKPLIFLTIPVFDENKTVSASFWR
jgi:hypothetical protein